MSLKWRVTLIVALCAISAWFLFPRDVTVRTRNAQGILQDEKVRRIPLKPGLDLSGGMYLALEVDDSKQKIAPSAKAEAIDRALKTVRTRLEGYGTSETVVEKQGNDRIVVSIPGISDEERARKLVEDQAFLEFKITDKTGALERALPRLDQVVKQRGLATAKATGDTSNASLANSPANKGLQGLLTSGDTSKKTADSSKKIASATKDSAAAADSVKLQPGGAFSSLLQGGQMPGEYYVDNSQTSLLESFLEDSAVAAAMPPGKQLLPSTDSVSLQGKTYRAFYVVDSKPIMTGDHLKSAQPNNNTVDGTVVEFELDNVGGRTFRTQTGNHVGDYMAISLDGRVMGRPPVIQSAIGTRGQITMGGKSLADAQDLALVLRAGALPVPLRVAQSQKIGPTLGQDSIDKGRTASIIAVALVVIIMITYYRFSGVLAVGGLILYILYTLAALAGFDAAITMPGIAGFVLSIGIAVDANVLIFERIREELAHGKTVRTAIDEGFRHAMPAIIDSNVSTILTAAVLYQYGTGAVKGFAVTLIAGIFASLITSIFVVRTFYLLWLNRTRGAQTLSI
ncbi:MAG TPA: protein translocase subunit SecD [Gemmatimonadaceae bacterium]|jgi:preprotein translocase subunit SecD